MVSWQRLSIRHELGGMIEFSGIRSDSAKNQTHKFSIAPMMEWTDRHCRFFHRLLTRRALIYTEMVTSGAILHGDRERLLDSIRRSIRWRCSLAAPTRECAGGTRLHRRRFWL